MWDIDKSHLGEELVGIPKLQSNSQADSMIALSSGRNPWMNEKSRCQARTPPYDSEYE